MKILVSPTNNQNSLPGHYRNECLQTSVCLAVIHQIFSNKIQPGSDSSKRIHGLLDSLSARIPEAQKGTDVLLDTHSVRARFISMVKGFASSSHRLDSDWFLDDLSLKDLLNYMAPALADYSAPFLPASSERDDRSTQVHVYAISQALGVDIFNRYEPAAIYSGANPADVRDADGRRLPQPALKSNFSVYLVQSGSGDAAHFDIALPEGPVANLMVRELGTAGQLSEVQQPVPQPAPPQTTVRLQPAAPVLTATPVQTATPSQPIPVQQPATLQTAEPVQRTAPVQPVPVQQPATLQRAIPVQTAAPVQRTAPVQPATVKLPTASTKPASSTEIKRLQTDLDCGGEKADEALAFVVASGQNVSTTTAAKALLREAPKTAAPVVTAFADLISQQQAIIDDCHSRNGGTNPEL